MPWGGGGPDGRIHVSEEYLLTCNEVYEFKTNLIKPYTESSGLNCTNFSQLSKAEKNKLYERMRSTHAMRLLNDSAFLVIYNRPGNILEYNGVIYSFDLVEMQKFKYYGFMEDMEAILMSNEKYSKDTIVLFDRERKKLLFVEKDFPYNITEIGTEEMKQFNEENNYKEMKLIIEYAFPRFEFRKDKNGVIHYKITEY